MGREGTWFGELNTSTNSYLFLPFYGVSSCSVNIIKIDNATTNGNVYVCNVIPKVYAYDSQLYNNDSPSAIYGFPTVDQSLYQSGYFFVASTTTAPRESMSGRLCSVSGSLQAGNYTVARLAGKYLMVPPNASVVDTTTGIVAALENAGSPYAVEAWIYRTTATLGAFYTESNAGITSYIQFGVDATGHLFMGTNAGIRVTGTTAIPLFQWTHVAIAYTGAGIIFYVNNAAQVSSAYTHATGIATPTQRIINVSATGAFYTQSVAVYGYQLSASSIDRHYGEITGYGVSPDYNSGGVYDQGFTMSNGASVQVVYTNNALPSAVQVSGVYSVILPLQGIGRIRMFNGIYKYEIHTEELDV